MFEKKTFGIGLIWVVDNNASALLVDNDPRHGSRREGHELPRLELRLRPALCLVAIHIVFTTAGFMPFQWCAARDQRQQADEGCAAKVTERVAERHIRLD